MKTQATRRRVRARVLRGLLLAPALVTLAGCVEINNHPPAGPSQAPPVAAPTTAPVAGTATTTTTSTATTSWPASSTTSTSSARDTVVLPPADVVSITDGDTLKVKLEGTEVDVRVLGIDTPEMNYGKKVNGKTKEPECGAREATSHLYELLFDSPKDSDGDGLYDTGDWRRQVLLTIEPGPGDVYDEHGRLLAYVSVEEQDVGRAQISAGWAWTYAYRNRQFGQRSAYEDHEEQARDSGEGGWSACPEIFRWPR